MSRSTIDSLHLSADHWEDEKKQDELTHINRTFFLQQLEENNDSQTQQTAITVSQVDTANHLMQRRGNRLSQRERNSFDGEIERAIRLSLIESKCCEPPPPVKNTRTSEIQDRNPVKSSTRTIETQNRNPDTVQWRLENANLQVQLKMREQVIDRQKIEISDLSTLLDNCIKEFERQMEELQIVHKFELRDAYAQYDNAYEIVRRSKQRRSVYACYITGSDFQLACKSTEKYGLGLFGIVLEYMA